MKYSIIIPVYNVEKYLAKCLDSIIDQSYSKYEVIIVNDGTKDNSQEIIDKYVKKDQRFKSYIKDNGGLSDARNYGVKYAKGEYIIFVDSDDSINKDLLLKLNEEITKINPDIVRISYQIVSEESKIIKEVHNNSFSNFKKDEAIKMLLKDDILVMAWSYCYNLKFWKKNRFEFFKGRIHEDYGLIPYVLTKAKIFSSLNYIGYNYLVREGSIMNTKDEEKDYKKAIDVFEQCNYIVKKIDSKNYSDKLIQSFYANGVLRMINKVPNSKTMEYKKKIKDSKIINYLLEDNFKRKVKKLFYKIILSF